jgi:hypothetical protein
MTVDRTLTLERALEEIGDLVVPDYPGNRPMGRHYEGIHQTIVDGVFDTTFTISEESRIMQLQKQWRVAQIAEDFEAEKTRAIYQEFKSALSCGIFGDLHAWEEQLRWTRFSLFFESDHVASPATVHYEILYNALEQGSHFGTWGPVSIRFRGGEQGALLQISDPGRGQLTMPLSMDQMVNRLVRAGSTFKHPPKDHRDFIYPEFTEDSSLIPIDRGMGGIVATVGKPVVNDYTSPEGYTVLLLYKPTLMPGYWKEELLKPRLI